MPFETLLRQKSVLRALGIAVMSGLGGLVGGWAGAVAGAVLATLALCLLPQDRIRPTSPSRRLGDEPQLWGG